MRSLLVTMAVAVTLLSGCLSTEQDSFLLSQDKRVSVAENLTQEGRLADSLVQWQILQALHPRHPEIDFNIERLQIKITQRKAKLMKRLALLQKMPQDANKEERKVLMLKALALTPNDVTIKESLREMIWDKASEEASQKNQTIVKYIEDNQEKAQKSIELASYLEQGASFIESKKYVGLLQLADKLNEVSPDHIDVNRFKYTAYNSLGDGALNEKQYDAAIAHYENAIIFAGKQKKQNLIKKVADLRNLLAVGYFSRGQEAFIRQDLEEAIALYKQALAFDSSYQKAKQQLNRAQTMQANLLKIKRLQN